MTLTGTLAQINTTLAAANNVVYRGVPNFNGSDTLTVSTSDGGNTGTGGAADRQRHGGDHRHGGERRAGEHGAGRADASLRTPTCRSPDCRSATLMPASATITTTLSVLNGTLTVSSAGGAAVAGSGTGTVTLTGTLAQINTTLAAANNVVYNAAWPTTTAATR